jgi:hypothetical protein
MGEVRNFFRKRRVIRDQDDVVAEAYPCNDVQEYAVRKTIILVSDNLG